MALTSVKVSFNIKDGVGRISRMRLNAAYPVGDDFTTTLSDATAVANAIDALIEGNQYSFDIQIPVGHAGNVPDARVERGDKTVIVGRESVGNLRYFVSSLPTRLKNNTLYGDDQHYIASAAEWIAFVSAYNGLAVSPDGNALTFQDAYLATRRK